MEIIVLGDIHMATDAIRTIAGIEEADLVILNGDLTNYGTTRDARKVLDGALQVNPNVLAQFGNLDRPEINDYLEDLGINIHGQAKLVQSKVCIVGVGGSNFTPFNTPSEFAENEIQTIATHALRQGIEYAHLAAPLHNKKIPVILISHAPPFKTKVDKIRSGKHVGSQAIRSAIERYQPDLCVCGHIHESKGKDMIVNTPVYNPGMSRLGGCVSISVNQSQLDACLQ